MVTVYPRFVHGERSHADTEPEERGGGDRGGRPVLVVSSYDRRLQIELPDEGALTMGRGQPSEVATGEGPSTLLIPDQLLSRHHLRISGQARGHVVEDLGSRNGTYLDGRRLSAPMRLAEGSILLFGSQVAVFRRLSDAARAALRQEADHPFGPVGTSSPGLALVLARLRKLARTDAELLLVGETGVGKEVCARAVHQASGRAGKFVAVNCASLPATLVESELFGYAAGAHSTARVAKPGLVEAAEQGTLLLDEIGDMPADLQAKIFRFLQERTISPLGSMKHRRIDVRLIAATTRVDATVDRASMRGDLVARLGADPIEIPPLRARPEDVPALLAHFAGGEVDQVEPAALRALCLYGWPLNVRELEKVARTATALTEGRELRLEHLPASIQGALDRGPLITARRSPRAAPERAELEHLLRAHDGNVAEVARALDRKWNVVWRWIVRLGLNPGQFRRPERPR